MGLIGKFFEEERSQQRRPSASGGMLAAKTVPARVPTAPAVGTVAVRDLATAPAARAPAARRAAPSGRRVLATLADLPELGGSEILTVASGPYGLRTEDQEVAVLIRTPEGRVLCVWTNRPEHAAVFTALRHRLERDSISLDVSQNLQADRKLIREIYAAGGEELSSAGSMMSRDDTDELIDGVITRALERGASDVHINVFERHTDLKFRLDGLLRKIEEPSRQWGEQMSRGLFRRADADSKGIDFNPRIEQDASLRRSVKMPDGRTVEVKLRYSSGPVWPEGWDVVLRVLALGMDGNAKTLPGLGYEGTHVNALSDAVIEPNGLVMLVGATGSGKSTTIKALAEMLDDYHEGLHSIISIEDPPEYVLRNTRQKPVFGDDRKGFAKVLRGAMRKDPDIIIVGEIRDEETAVLAQQATLTGHQVLTTLHASSLDGAVKRLINLGMDHDVLASEGFLQAVMRQTLVPVNCPDCATPLGRSSPKPGKEPEWEDVMARLSRIGQPLDGVRVLGPGCETCGGTGTNGRTVAAEVMVPDWHMRDAILNQDLIALRAYWRVQALLDPAAERIAGGMTMLEHAMLKVVRGEVCPVQAFKRVGRRELDPMAALDILDSRKQLTLSPERLRQARERLDEVRAHG
jgi:type II secretory ATPase GspE/PulE/Tfp pilus assembly ATPase PilB-like protein